MSEESGFDLTIVYDSGAVVNTKVKSFKVHGGTYEWECMAGYQILILGADHVIAVHAKAI